MRNNQNINKEEGHREREFPIKMTFVENIQRMYVIVRHNKYNNR